MTKLPKGWRRLPTSKLEPYFDLLDDSTDDYHDLAMELDMRYSAARDDRIAQGMGIHDGGGPS